MADRADEEGTIDFASMIRNAREQRGWTRLELYVHTGIRPSTNEKHETGTEPRASAWLAYCKAFDWPHPLLALVDLTGDNRCFDQTAIYQPEQDLILLPS